MRITQLFLLVQALALMTLGLAYFIQPHEMTNISGMLLMAPAAITDVRAYYGGLQLGLAAYLLIGVWAGLQVVFQLTPGTEAPSEMNLYLPQMQALCIAENAVKSLHNLLTPRGAEVRDGKAWAQFLDDALVRYGDKAQVMFAQHNWPTWGGEQIRTLLADEREQFAQRDLVPLNRLSSRRQRFGEADFGIAELDGGHDS